MREQVLAKLLTTQPDTFSIPSDCCGITRAPEWRSGPWHCISVQEASPQSLLPIQAVSHLAVIGSPIGRRAIGPASSGFGGVGRHWKQEFVLN